MNYRDIFTGYGVPGENLQFRMTPYQSGSGGGAGGNPYGRANARGGASATTSAPTSDPSLASGYANANTQMQSYLNGPAPQYQGPGPNRFETGLAASEGRLSSLLDDPSSIQQTASYKFRVGEGQKALERRQFAQGVGGSGGAAMEFGKYMQDMGSQEYENQANRLQNLLGTYSGAWNQAQGTNVQESLGRFGTEMQGHTARGNTLANLVGTATQGYTTGRGQDMTAQSQANALAARDSGGGGTTTVTGGGGWNYGRADRPVMRWGG